MATAGTAKHSLLGTWRIVATELWDVDDLDLTDPAHRTLEPKGHGRLGLLAIEADLDYRVRCAQARGTRGIRDIAVATGIPQYRLRAIETGRLTEFRLGLAGRYFRFLGIETWIAQWCRANRELATRVGLLDAGPRDRRARQPRRG
jgi:hypothetical protein